MTDEPRQSEIARLYEDHGPALVAYACSLLPDRAAAEDVVHQVFLKLLIGRIALPEVPRPYLFRAVRNAALNRRRSNGRWERQDTDAWFEPVREDPDAAILVQGALLDLPAEQREVVMLRIWGQMTLEEVADVVGVPLNTAASRYRYALAKLRQKFQPVEI